MTLKRIAHYEVDRLIGSGGMGEVYLAEDMRLHRKVALKLLPERFTGDEERIHRFQREARAVSALNHPNILTIHDIGEANRRHYIATEYIEGRTLRERIATDPPMTTVEILDVAIGIASALAAAHDAGIIHRDIKPENIMLRRDGLVKVLDFGLAKLTDRASSIRDTSTGAVMGTLLYISPEQARGMSPDWRSDIYSLGAVIYEMITRQPPVATDSFVELAMTIASVEPQPPSAIRKGIPPELDRIVLKALAKDPAHRYQSAHALVHDLRTLRREMDLDEGLHDSGGFSSQQTAILAQRTQTSSVFARIRRGVTRARGITLVAIILSALLIGYAVARNGFWSGPIDSVAVLPFENMTGDPDAEYLSDGIPVSILDSLSQLPGLQVVARSVVFRYKGRKVDPVLAGRELGVRAVVTGELQQRADTLIISARMTDVEKETQVWGQQYTRKLADVLDLQRDMSQEISEELRRRLTGEERQLLTRHSTTSSEAFRLYLKGRHLRNKYEEDAVRRAIDCFQQAIELDPSYALAYAGLADAYHGLSNVWMRPREAMPRAREAARRALQLDDTLPEAHAALALVLVWYDWDFVAGEREFRRAIELNPNDAEAHRLYGDYLIATGHFDRALQEKKAAEEIDPLSVPASWDVGRALFYAGRLAEADEQLRRTLELDDRFVYPYMMRAQIALLQGRNADAVALVEKAIAVGGRTPFTISMWGYIHGRAGHRRQALQALEELQSRRTYLLPIFVARVHAAIGNRDEAIAALEQLYAEKSESVVWLKVDATLASLRDDPRFQELLQRVGL